MNYLAYHSTGHFADLTALPEFAVLTAMHFDPVAVHPCIPNKRHLLFFLGGVGGTGLAEFRLCSLLGRGGTGGSGGKGKKVHQMRGMEVRGKGDGGDRLRDGGDRLGG